MDLRDRKTITTITDHEIKLAGGKPLKFCAEPNFLTIRESKRLPINHLFYIYYYVPVITTTKRPIMFLWGGGPGGATTYALQLGSFGPYRVSLPRLDQACSSTSHAQLQENPYTLLASCDLVFIDAPCTGYSFNEPEKPTREQIQFQFSVIGDALIFTSFIKEFINQYQYWEAPKFLYGISYGTIRACMVLDMLQRDGINVDGVVLASCVLNYQHTWNGPETDDSAFVGLLPTYVALNWYHHQRFRSVFPDLGKVLRIAMDLSRTWYKIQLGESMMNTSSHELQQIQLLAQLTGMKPRTWLRYSLRVPLTEFRKKIVHSSDPLSGRVCGRYDGRCLGTTYYPTDSFDPSAQQSRFVFAFRRFMHDKLKFPPPRQPYRFQNPEALNLWNFSVRSSTSQDRMVNVLPLMLENLARNQNLQFFVGFGVYDLATPFYLVITELLRVIKNNDIRERIHVKLLEAGHNITWIDSESRTFSQSIAKFIQTIRHDHWRDGRMEG